jgi:hypothetical protein
MCNLVDLNIRIEPDAFIGGEWIVRVDTAVFRPFKVCPYKTIRYAS